MRLDLPFHIVCGNLHLLKNRIHAEIGVFKHLGGAVDSLAPHGGE